MKIINYDAKSIKDSDIKLLFIFVSIILIIICSLFYIMQISNFINTNSFLNNIKIFKISLQVIGVMLFFLILVYKYIRTTINDWLTTFERRIILEQLPSQEIREAFIKEFIGQTTLAWLANIEGEIVEKSTILDKSLDEYKIMFIDINNSELSNEDRIQLIEMNIEYTDAAIQKCEDYSKFVSKSILMIKDFINHGGITREEKNWILDFINKWEDINKSKSLFNTELKNNLVKMKDELKKDCKNCTNKCEYGLSIT
ncbi:MAG TPA: hypothetical protein VHT96_16925 [Clostridia bacterium]|nr:hypothetical protein [Clostridia bacterium]